MADLALLLRRWSGVGLTLVGVVATLILAASGRLNLYIHPRYVIFSVVMCVLAGAVAILAPVLGADDHAGHDHEPDRGRPLGTVVRALIIVGAVLALLVVPPSTLSTRLAQDRGLAAPAGSQPATRVTIQGDSTSYTIKDWWTLLQAGQPALIEGKTVHVIGQVHDQGSAENFYVARQMITCCAVDAQLIGLAVKAPQWSGQWPPGQWVEVTGTFVTNPGVDAAAPYVIEPTAITATVEPRDPYVY